MPRVKSTEADAKKEILKQLKGMSKDYLVDLGHAYISGGGFGDVRKMTKPQIIKILMSGKTSFYEKGGVVKKNYVNPVKIVNNIKK